MKNAVMFEFCNKTEGRHYTILGKASINNICLFDENNVYNLKTISFFNCQNIGTFTLPEVISKKDINFNRSYSFLVKTADKKYTRKNGIEHVLFIRSIKKIDVKKTTYNVALSENDIKTFQIKGEVIALDF